MVYGYLKVKSGGYHADTHGGCIVVTNISYLFIIIFLKKFGIETLNYSFIVFWIASLILVYIYAPMEDRRKKIEQDEKAILKKQARFRFIQVSMVNMLLMLFDIRQIKIYTVFITTALICVGLNLIAGRIKQNK